MIRVTKEQKDFILYAVRQVPGLGMHRAFDGKRFCVCGIISAVACGNPVAFYFGSDSGSEGGDILRMLTGLDETSAHRVYKANDAFKGTPRERKRYMLKWLDENLTVRP